MSDRTARLQQRLYDMKRDWLAFIAQAEARGDRLEAQAFRDQLERIEAMLASTGADPQRDVSRRPDS